MWVTINNKKLLKNISWIFVGNVLHSLLQFLLNIYAARKLALGSNGQLNYAASLIALLTAIASLGYSNTITREFTVHKDRIGDYLCSCILSCAGTGVLCMAVAQIVVRILNPGEPELYLITLCQSTTIVFSSTNLFVYWYRYKNKADIAAVLRLLAFGLSAFWRILVLKNNGSLAMYATGTAMETVFFGFLLGIFFIKNYKGSFRYSLNIAQDVLKGSYPFIFAAILTTVYGQADKLMIKSFIDSEAVALYSVSALLAGALSMIPNSLIEAFRPDIMEYKLSNEIMYRKRFRQLYAIIFWASMCYGIIVTIFAKQIILILYGEKYIGAVSSLSLIVWYSAFSYFGAVNNMYMVAEKKSKWVQITTLCGAVGNIILNAAMIPVWGIVGAAIATLITQFFTNFVMMRIIPELSGGFELMIQGIRLHDILGKKAG